MASCLQLNKRTLFLCLLFLTSYHSPFFSPYISMSCFAVLLPTCLLRVSILYCMIFEPLSKMAQNLIIHTYNYSIQIIGTFSPRMLCGPHKFKFPNSIESFLGSFFGPAHHFHHHPYHCLRWRPLGCLSSLWCSRYQQHEDPLVLSVPTTSTAPTSNVAVSKRVLVSAIKSALEGSKKF